MKPNTGIAAEDRAAIAQGLSRLLADSYTLYLKTHNYHWNVTGPQFPALHALFETQYSELATAVDEVAERIRALGQAAPGSYKAFAALTSIEEADEVPVAAVMVSRLADDHEALARTARAVLPAAESGGDEVTLGLLADRMAVHEKTAWMLRATAA